MKKIEHGNLSIFFFAEAVRFKSEKNFFPLSFFTDNILISNSSGFFAFDACGFFIGNGSIYVIFPKGFTFNELNNRELIKHTHLLLQVFRKYNLQNNSSIESEKAMFGELENTDAVFSLLDILEDYLSHGNLVREKKIKEFGYNGRIDWKQTLNKTVPLISGGMIHYVPPVITRKVYEHESMLQKIHRICVADAFKRFGWMFGTQSPEDFRNVPVLNISDEEILRVLHLELKVTFFDRDIHIIKLMIRYFKGIFSEKVETPESFFLYSRYFHNIFESMCMDVFNGIPAAEFNIPKPVWNMSDGSKKTTTQIPDVLVPEGDNLYVIDAKYYDFHYTLPGWGDLVKQHFYGFSFQNRYKKVHNIFIMPSTHEEFLQLLGYSTVPEVQVFNNSIINAFTVDMKKLMNAYLNNINLQAKEELKRHLK